MSPISLRSATPQDIPHLDAVERSAAHLYEATALSTVAEHTLGEQALLRMVQTDTVWLACCGAEIKGFAACFPSGRTLHLQELSVCASSQGHGIGRKLLRHVIDIARDRAFQDITLCTFRDLPWCRPFYETAGFRVVGEADMSAELCAIWKREYDGFPRVAPRVAMILSLSF